MKFSDKLKSLRQTSGMTQDELAQKLYVTRTAVSKWETDKGFPAIDSLKLLADTFHVTIDELISDDDVITQRALDEKNARRMYWIAMACFAVTAATAVIGAWRGLPWLYIVSVIGMIGYVVCAFFAKPKYKRAPTKNTIVSIVLSRVLIGVVIAIVLVTMILQGVFG